MNELDTKIAQLIDKVQQRKAEIEKLDKPKWRTHLSFGYNESNADRTNIATVSNVNKLVDMAAYLLARESAWNSACEQLGQSLDFTWLGYSAQDWISDIRTKIEKLQISTKKEELSKMEKALDSLISPEQRRAIEIERFEKLLA